MATRTGVSAVVARYLEALERFDLEAAADCFTDDLFYSHPPYSAEDNGGLRHEVRGREALIGLFRERGRRPVAHKIRSSATDGSSAFVEGVFTVNDEIGGVGRLPRRTGRRRRHSKLRRLCQRARGGRGAAASNSRRSRCRCLAPVRWQPLIRRG